MLLRFKYDSFIFDLKQLLSRSAVLGGQVIASPGAILNIIKIVSSCTFVVGVIKILAIKIVSFHPKNICVSSWNNSCKTILLSIFDLSKSLRWPITITIIVIIPIDIVNLIPPIPPTCTSAFWYTLDAFSVSRIHIPFQDLKVWFSQEQLVSAIISCGVFITCLELNKVVACKISISC